MAPRSKRETLGDLDVNGDGVIDEKDSAGTSSGGDDFSSELGGLFGDAPAAGSGRGAPLWPYTLPADSDGTEFSVADQSSRGRVTGNKRTGPRYFEADTLAPLRWSPEQRAQMQTAMWKLGLYGKDKIRLGSWGKSDQAVFALLLGQANVDGREWFEQLAYWKRFPPTDLLDQMNGEAGPKPTLRVSNPLDIRTAADRVTQGLIGRRDDSFAAAATPAYQGQEIAAQKGVIADQEGGGGGTATDAPTAEAFLADKLRKENPLEVDGYAFMGGFETLLDMVGAR